MGNESQSLEPVLMIGYQDGPEQFTTETQFRDHSGVRKTVHCLGLLHSRDAAGRCQACVTPALVTLSFKA